MINRAALVLLITVLIAGSVLAEEIEVLELESLGIPSPATRREKCRLSELKFFDGRLYLGTGDAVVNTGATEVLAFDLEKQTTEIEFTVDDEAIYRYCVLDGKLTIPGPDATESWEFGNVYVREKDGWVKHRTLPKAIHVNDLVSVGGIWLATTGTSFEFAEGIPIAAGSILISRNKGKTWAVDHLTGASGVGVFRVDRICLFKDRLYAFPYAYAGFPVAQIPPEVSRWAGPAEVHGGRKYQTLYLPDRMGSEETLTRTVGGWKPLDVIPEKDICRVHPIPFGDLLLLSVTAGKQVAPFAGYTIDRPIPVPGARLSLWAFTGEKTVRVPFEYDGLFDAVERDGLLSLLVVKGGHYWIAETRDLEKWRWLALPLDQARPLCLERIGDTYYLGAKDGNLFRTTGEMSSVDDPDRIGDVSVKSFELRGSMIRELHGYWAAVTRIEKPGLPVRAGFDAMSPTEILVTATNVVAMRIFIPIEVGAEGSFTLFLNGQGIQGDTSTDRVFDCFCSPDGTWELKPVENPPATYEPKPQIIGVSEDDFELGDPDLAQWAADALAAKAGVDLTLVPVSNFRAPLPKGPVSIQDVHDLVYRNRIAVLDIRAPDLVNMLCANREGPAKHRCRFAGPAAKHIRETGAGLSISLDPERTYRVALPDYPATRGERYFGKDLGLFEVGSHIHTALIEHLLRTGKISRSTADPKESEREDD